jgi:transcriptional regulator with XRE-family HTH domain
VEVIYLFDKNEFAKRLKTARENKGLKQKELAKELNIVAQTLSAYETGLKLPTLENAVALAEKLNVSLDWLLNVDCNSQTAELKTLGDIVRTASLIFAACPFLRPNGLFPYYTDYAELNDMSPYKKIPDFRILVENRVLEEFLRNSDKMKDLLNDGTISLEIYNMWYIGQLSELDKISIDSQVEVEELPF